MTTITVPAVAVAAPVIERLGPGARGRVLGSGDGLALAAIDGFVVLLSTADTPMLPNAVVFAGSHGMLAAVALGDPASYRPGSLRLGPIVARWDPARPPVWEPRVVPVVGDPGRVRRRGEALFRALGATLPHAERAVGTALPEDVPPLASLMALAGTVIATEAGGASALGALLDAVARRDIVAASSAARVLSGRGAGLTPEGDDVLVAVTASLVTLGLAVGFPRPALAAWTGALAPPEAAGRTTDLARTLVWLAAHGRILEPAGRLLDLTATGERRWPSALTRLLRARCVSGRAYAAGIAATACALTAKVGRPRRAWDARRPVGARVRAAASSRIAIARRQAPRRDGPQGMTTA